MNRTQTCMVYRKPCFVRSHTKFISVTVQNSFREQNFTIFFSYPKEDALKSKKKESKSVPYLLHIHPCVTQMDENFTKCGVFFNIVFIYPSKFNEENMRNCFTTISIHLKGKSFPSKFFLLVTQDDAKQKLNFLLSYIKTSNNCITNTKRSNNVN